MKIINFFLSLIFLFAVIPNCIANSESDTLAILLQKMPKDTNYVRAAEQYAWKLLNYLDDEKRAEKVLLETEKLAYKLNDYKGVARMNWYLGYLYMRNEKNNEAFNLFRKSEIYVNKYNLLPNERQLAYSGLGMYYEFVNQYDKSIKYFSQAIELTEKHHLKEFILQAYISISRLYIPIDFKKYETYIQKLIQLINKEKIQSMRYLAELTLSDFYLYQKDYQKSKYHSQQSLFLAKKYCRKASIIPSWIAISTTFIRLNQLDSAYFYINRAVKLAEKLNNDFRKADAYASMGMYYEYKKQYSLAEKYNLKTLEIDKKGNYGFGVKLDYDKLADLNLLLKDYKKAHDYRVKSYKLNDSLFSLNLAMKVNKLEKEKQDANVKLLKLENESSIFQRNAILLGGILFFLFSVSIVILIFSRSKYKRLEAQQRLRNQIATDLHDEIGSTLSSISILSEIVAFQQKSNASKPEIMQQVSNDARDVIDKMDDIIWTINPENDAFYNLETRLKSFAIPLFESKDIDFKFNFSPELETVKIDMGKRRDIYLILKEAINNLVKYSESKTAIIKGDISDNMLTMSVIDNGIGFDSTAVSVRNGQKNMRFRAMKIGADLEIKSIIREGTEVKLSIKV